jgi:prepilin-type N-terminal cleavage/methylation domain-containing protein
MKSRRRGFTLIEVMIAVAIIGILAAIAIPNYLRHALRAKQTEGSVLLGAIRTSQLTFSAANGCFATIPQTPPGAPTPNRQIWTAGAAVPGNPCGGVPLSFENLQVRPNGGSTYFVYACSAQATPAEFTCNARGDLDGDGLIWELMFCSDQDGDGAGIPSPAGTACTFPWEPIRSSVDQF